MRQNSFRKPAASRGRVFPNSRYTGNQSKRTGAYINPDKFVNKAIAPVDQTVFVPVHTFKDFPFTEALQSNLAAKGYLEPTPIQDVAIKPVLEGKDLVGLANTGTGKTAAFLLPIITKLQRAGGRGQALIVVPTRELATQIDDEFRGFAQNLRLYAAVCVGGVSAHGQINALKRRPQVIIGTPGRLKDLANQGMLNLEAVTTLVLDEADRMFDMGFIRDIQFLVGKLPRQRQSLCFSATMPPEIELLVRQVLSDPVKVSVRTAETSQQVDQDVIKAESKERKLQILAELLRQPDYEKVMIFNRTKWGTQHLADNLEKQNFKVEAIHGNKSQSQRQRALNSFREGKVQVLVATDVAARGIDIPNVSHVINYDQPNTYDDYIHRIGRTGRAGKTGKALTFIS